MTLLQLSYTRGKPSVYVPDDRKNVKFVNKQTGTNFMAITEPSGRIERIFDDHALVYQHVPNQSE